MGEQADEARAQQIFEKCNKVEEQFGENFTGKIPPIRSILNQTVFLL